MTLHVVVQHCCIETWFLGNHRLKLRALPSPKLAEYLAHYDVRALDPEAMPLLMNPDHRHIHRFHQAYLREMLHNAEPRLQCTKTRPDPVLTPGYFEALRARVEETDHLPSLRHLLETWTHIATSEADPEAGARPAPVAAPPSKGEDGRG